MTCGRAGWHNAHLTRRARLWLLLRYGIAHRIRPRELRYVEVKR